MTNRKDMSNTGTGPQRAVAGVIYAVALVLVLLPVYEWVANAMPFYSDPYDLATGLFNLPGRVFVLVGFVLMFYQFVLGIRIPALERVFTRATNLRRHQTLGKIGFLLILLHGLFMLAYDRALVGRFLFDPYRVIGMVALVLLIVAVMAAWHYRALKLPRKVWKPVHMLAYVVFPLGFLHARTLGTELATSWVVNVLFSTLFVLYCVLVVYRIYIAVAGGAGRRAGQPR